MNNRVTGIGGIFIKAKDPKALYAWYEKNLGMRHDAGAQAVPFAWKDAVSGEDAHTYWSLFKDDTKYMEPSQAPFMINYRVADMDAIVSTLEAEGIKILGRQDEEYGRFAWLLDPEGNKIELWEPPRKK